MAGLKQSKLNSIQARLIISLSVAIVFAAMLAIFATYSIAFREASELQDATLQQVMALMIKNKTTRVDQENINPESGLLIFELTKTSENTWVSDSDPSVGKQLTIKTGFTNLTLHHAHYRALIQALSANQVLVIAQPTILRDDAASSSAITSVLPLILLIPILSGFVYWGVQSALKPVQVLAEQMTDGNFDDLSSLEAARIPNELQPFINAINQLFLRVANVIELQKRFVADAAHELRTPLTALSLQSEQLLHSQDTTKISRLAQSIHASVHRCNHLANQLLTLTKVQSASPVQLQLVNARELLVEVIEEVISQMEFKQIGLTVELPDQLPLPCYPVEFKTIFRNLIGNAIKFTPDHGCIVLSAVSMQSGIQICVEDNGPGIDSAEIPHVFQAFYRGQQQHASGVGLGLAIVRSALERVNGSIKLDQPTRFASGLRAIVTFNTP